MKLDRLDTLLRAGEPLSELLRDKCLSGAWRPIEHELLAIAKEPVDVFEVRRLEAQLIGELREAFMFSLRLRQLGRRDDTGGYTAAP